MAIDILAFGIHPDDVELGAGGFLALESSRGRSCGIVDLTQGEMSTNGNKETRQLEAQRSARTLGIEMRLNLGFADRGLTTECIHQVVQEIRAHQPSVVLLPYGQDRHPDHELGSKLLSEAVFNAGLIKYDTGQASWKAASVWYYFINFEEKPAFLVDVSSVYAQKTSALQEYASQFSSGQGNIKTRLNSNLLYYIESRDRLFGAKIGVEFAEGFALKEPLALQDPFSLLGGKS